MSLVMVDTSVWIEFFRSGKKPVCDKLDVILQQDEAAICGIIEMELLRGVRKHEKNTLKNRLAALHYLKTEREDFINAGEKLNQLRNKGITIPSTDALIGQICIKNGIKLLTMDHHFDHLEEVVQY